MEIRDLLKEGREIWGDERLSLNEIVPRLGKNFGDICKVARKARPDDYNEEELKKELGNTIFSLIRWTDDLGFDIEECIEKAKKAQREFPK